MYRHFALSYHPFAVITAEATEAAGAQGKDWEMHDLLYERQGEWTYRCVVGERDCTEKEIDDRAIPRLVEYAEELGLDTERFAQELSDHVYQDKVNADTQGAQEAGLPGTPSYIVNGVLYPMQELGLHPLPIDGFIRLRMIDQYAEVPPPVIEADKEYVATIRTNKGDIVVELFADRAPLNVNSFVFLAWSGWYDGLDFFYVEPGTAAYSGDPTGMGWGFDYPGYYCSDEISSDLTFDQAGMLAFYSPTPGRNSGLFFITYEPEPDLDGQHTIIGHIIKGMDVVESLTPTQPGPDQPEPDVIETILVEAQ